jgi:hypothetical protein
MTWDIESIIAETEPAEAVVTICTKGSLRAEYERLAAQLPDTAEAALSLAGTGGAQIADRMTELREQMRAYERPFTLRAVTPRRAWRNLVARQPVKAQGMDDEQFADLYHSWLCSVVAASAVDPPMTAEQVERFADKLSDGDWSKLANKAWKTNDQSAEIPFSAAASVLSRGSGAKSKRPETSGSPDPDSWAESHDSEPSASTTPQVGSLAG